MTVIDDIRRYVRKLVGHLARFLDHYSRGRLTPNMVTYSSLVMHLPIAVLIGMRHFIWAAMLLVIFGLFDVLDGELARLQKKASTRGMLLDATTDRIKEILIFSGVAYALSKTAHPEWAAAAVVAVGASLLVSYV